MRSDLVRHGIVALFVLLFAAMTGSALLTHAKLRDVERQRALIEEAKISWIALQAETELYRFALAAERFSMAPMSGRAALETRFDIYWSRIALLETVERRQQVSDLIGSAEFPDVAALFADIERLEPLVADPDADPRAVVAAVRAHADRWLPPLVAAARDLYQIDLKEQAAAARRVVELSRDNFRTQLLLAGAILVAAVSGALILRRNRRLEARAEEARRALDDAMAIAPFAVAFLRRDGRLAAANPSFAAMTAIDGDHWRAGESRAEHLARMQRNQTEDAASWLLAPLASSSEAVRRIETRPDGRQMLIEAAPHPTAGLAITVSDVTEFVRARSRAEDLSAERAELLAMAGHELRTPISALIGALDMAQISPPAAASANLAMARRAADQLLAIADDVLEFSSLEDGLFSIRPSIFVLADHLRAVVAAHRTRAKAAGLELRLDVPDLDGLAIRSDRLRLRQVLDNLIVNAIKYAGSGWIEVRAALERDGGAGLLTIEVEDSGPGVPARLREALFTPFRRFAPVADHGRSLGGLGLGLPICRRIAEGLGGGIVYAEGREGGALFRFRAPVELPERSSAAAAPASGAVALPAPTGASCLLVEDDALLAEIHAAQLSRICAEVQTARTVAEALEFTTARRFDLIVLDLLLPDGLGSEVATAVRASETAGAPRSAVAVLTAYADSATIDACRHAGADAVFRKPLDLEQLRSLLPPSPAGSQAAGRGGATPHLATRPVERMDPAAWAELTGLFAVERIVEHVGELDVELAAFLDGLETRLAALEEAGTREALFEEAHKLCGRAKLLGFRTLAAQLTTLEAACRVGEDEDVRTAASALRVPAGVPPALAARAPGVS